MLIHTGEPQTMSIHAGDEPHIHDILNVSFIKNPVYKTYPLSNPFVKMSYVVHRNS